MLNIAIIGYGYWGPNLLRNFHFLEKGKVSWVADLRKERLEQVARFYPGIKTTARSEEVIASPDVDAVVIATPVYTHYDLAKKALRSGKHVLLEKPMTSTVEQAEELIELAAKSGKCLMTDHTYLYHGAVQKIKESITSGAIGNIRYFDSTRINLGLFQPDINVLWDLAPHDLSILFYLVAERPVSVQALGISHTGNDLENIAYMTLRWKGEMIAHFNCSWSSPVKVRHILIGGDRKMILFNDLEHTEKVKIYDAGFEVSTDEEKREMLISYRAGDIYVPKLNHREALAGMAEDFIRAIEEGRKPVSGSHIGLSVVKVLAAAQKSIKRKGEEVSL